MHTANYSARKRNCGWRTRVLPPLPAPLSRKDPEGSQHACRLGKANGRDSVTFTLPVALYWIVNDTPSCVPSVIILRYLSYVRPSFSMGVLGLEKISCTSPGFWEIDNRLRVYWSMTEWKNGKKYRVGSFYSYTLSIKNSVKLKNCSKKSNEVKTVAARIKR